MFNNIFNMEMEKDKGWCHNHMQIIPPEISCKGNVRL